MMIQNQGRVGIGTTSPGSALEVASTNSSQLTLRNTDTTNGTAGYGNLWADNNGLWLQGHGDTSGESIMLNPNGGNVGIGIGAGNPPGAKLEIRTDIDITSNPDSKGLRLKESHGDWLLSLGVENVTNEGFAIRDISQGTYPFVIREETGNVGIGITSPGYDLDVAGQINADAERIGEYEKFDAGNVSASGGTTRERAIATFAMNEAEWSSTVGFFVEAHSNYYDTGYNKYYIEAGWYGMPDIFRVESLGDLATFFNLRLERDDGNALAPRGALDICSGELNESYTESYGYERYDCKVHLYTLYAQAEYYTNWNVTIASGGMNLFYGDATSEGYVGITKDSAYQEVDANTNDLDNVIYLGRDNIGINTFVPDAKLDVNGTAHLRSSLTMDSFIIGDEMSGITAANQLESLTIDGDEYLIATNVSSINIYSVSGSNLTKGESLYPVPNNETIHNAKTFVMGDQTYLSVAIEGNQLSQVYEWDATNKTFVALASSAGLLRVDAKDIEPFAIGNETYLAIAEIGDQAVIYRWTGSTFTAAGQWAYTNIQDIHDFQYIEIDDRNLLAFSADYLDDNGNNRSRLYIFEYDENTQTFNFEAPLQTLSIGATIERIQTFVRDEQTYIALAYDNSIALYQWNGTDAFFRYSWLTSNNASGAHYFTRGSDDYLLTTGVNSEARLYRWVHDRLEEVQRVGNANHNTQDAISINNGKTFVLANDIRSPIQYDWNTNLYVSPSSGNVSIGYSGHSHKLYVAGVAGGQSDWRIDSDSRLKTSVETIPSALEKILSLRGVTFEWKQEEFPDRNFADGTQIGLIAQEVEEVFPELVSQGEYKSVSYANLVSPLIEAVKELHALYQGHADRLAALEAQNAEQDNHIAHQDERIAHQDELIVQLEEQNVGLLKTVVQLEVRLAALEAAQ